MKNVNEIIIAEIEDCIRYTYAYYPTENIKEQNVLDYLRELERKAELADAVEWAEESQYPFVMSSNHKVWIGIDGIYYPLLEAYRDKQNKIKP